MGYNITLSDSMSRDKLDRLCNISESVQDDIYDGFGAMCFIVATICVYGLGIVLFIAGHISKRYKNADDEDVNVTTYMKRMRDVREQSRRNQALYDIKNIQSKYSAIIQDEEEETDSVFITRSASTSSSTQSASTSSSISDKLPEYDKVCLTSITEET